MDSVSLSSGIERETKYTQMFSFTDGNYILLDKMLKEKYPSSTIANIRGHEWGNELSMREIEVYIHNLDDLKNE